MGCSQKFNGYFWPQNMGNISEYLLSDNLSRTNCLNTFRMIAMIIFAAIYVHSYFGMDGQYIFYLIAFTQWGLIITGITFIILFICSLPRFRNSPGSFIHKLGFFFFELSWICEMVITIVFWAILVVFNHSEAKAYSWVVITFMIESHLIPMILLSIDFFQNQMEFQPRHGCFLAIIPIAYAAISIYFAFVYNIYAYPIDRKSVV